MCLVGALPVSAWNELLSNTMLHVSIDDEFTVLRGSRMSVAADSNSRLKDDSGHRWKMFRPRCPLCLCDYYARLYADPAAVHVERHRWHVCDSMRSIRQRECGQLERYFNLCEIFWGHVQGRDCE